MSERFSAHDQQVLGTLELVIYQRLITDVEEPYSEVHVDVSDFENSNGELIGVYKLSHFARVKTKPASVTLQTVRAK